MPAKSPRNPKRRWLTFYFDEELMEKINHFLRHHVPKSTKQGLMVAALTAYLREKENER